MSFDVDDDNEPSKLCKITVKTNTLFSQWCFHFYFSLCRSLLSLHWNGNSHLISKWHTCQRSDHRISLAKSNMTLDFYRQFVRMQLQHMIRILFCHSRSIFFVVLPNWSNLMVWSFNWKSTISISIHINLQSCLMRCENLSVTARKKKLN